MTRTILYITGSRADYGLMRTVLNRIHEHPKLSLRIVVTGMHLMNEFGYTIEEVQKDGFHCFIVDAKYETDTRESMAAFIGEFIQKLTPLVHTLSPDIILILGDRAEMLAGAIVGVYLSIPVVHIHGGEITSTVDDYARHAITKLADLHFPATEKSKERLLRLGEEPSRIFVTGAPGLDQILNEPVIDRNELAEKYQYNPDKPVILVVQHPVSSELEQAAWQMRETLEAVVALKHQALVIFPNADAGGRAMIATIEEYSSYPFIKYYANIRHRDYISLLREVSVLVGNSSSGIIEAPSLGLPVVNIGTRQEGRERADNIIDANYSRDSIIQAIRTALDDTAFRDKIKKCKNPYGDGKAAEKITAILSDIEINQTIPNKIKSRMPN